MSFYSKFCPENTKNRLSADVGRAKIRQGLFGVMMDIFA